MLNPKFKAVYLNQDHCTDRYHYGNHFTLMKRLKLKLKMVDGVKVVPAIEMTGRAVINIALLIFNREKSEKYHC